MIDKKWDFKQVVDNIGAVKDCYKGLISSFSIYQIKQKKILIQEIRKQIYGLGILEWQKDKIWEYMNDDESIITLLAIANRQNKQ